jgi:hypothetical protein
MLCSDQLVKNSGQRVWAAGGGGFLAEGLQKHCFGQMEEDEIHDGHRVWKKEYLWFMQFEACTK